MARVKDRTEDFKEASRVVALSHGYSELESIKELESFIIKHKKDYNDLHRTTKQKRDNIEHEVLILSKWLNSVTSQFDMLRSERFQDAINRAMSRRKFRRKTDAKAKEVSRDVLPQIVEAKTSTRAIVRVQEQLLDDETWQSSELSSMLDAVEETERKMMEMSALNHLILTHVQQQTQQIEQLYLQAVEATNNVEKGNKELSQAIQRNSSSRTFLVLFFVVLSFSVLFLD